MYPRRPAGPSPVPPASPPGNRGESDPSALATNVEGDPPLPGTEAGGTRNSRPVPQEGAPQEDTTLPAGCPLLALTSTLTTFVHFGATAQEEPDPDLLAVLRVLARLGRATGLAYQRRAKDAQATWKGGQKATARVLLHVYQLAQHLAEIGGDWFAEVCLRRAFRDLWQEQFVTKVPFPEDLAPFIAPVPLPPEQCTQIIPILRAEQEAGGHVPLSFVHLMQDQASGQVAGVAVAISREV